MNDFAKKWLEALRSGKYKQTIGCLEKDGRNCCLGVACRVFDSEFPGILQIETSDAGTKFDNQTVCLPPKVQEALGLRSNLGIDNLPVAFAYSLSGLNDNGASFEQIADRIESNPKGLFKEIK